MFYGWTSICLKATDMAASARFYRALGMEVVEEFEAANGDGRIVLRNGPFRLALMNFLKENCIHVRCADVQEVHAAARAALPAVSGEPRSYRAADVSATADGVSWMTRDPDGNAVFFDTNDTETGDAGQARLTAQILRDAERLLEAAGADAACRRALREVIDRYA